MRRRFLQLQRRWEEFRLYRSSARQVKHHREDFEAVESFCLFLGYPRSGHSLFGALIDAHPEAIISHELNCLRFVRAGFSREQIYALILQNSNAFRQSGRQWTGYDYSVPNQWQGRFKRLRVIGDKRGMGTSVLLSKNPGLLARLEATVEVPLRFIHVIRNPYDTISTMARRNQRDLPANMERFFTLSRGVLATKSRLPANAVLDIWHEEFLNDPRWHLARICAFLRLEPEAAYLGDCASIVYRSPHRSREEADWSPSLIQEVAHRMSDFPYFHGYSFES